MALILSACGFTRHHVLSVTPRFSAAFLPYGEEEKGGMFDWASSRPPLPPTPLGLGLSFWGTAM